MTSDASLFHEGFPRSNQYHPEWLIANVSGGANALWLTEWLAPALDLKPGMRVLDLGCGRACSSIFLRREYGVQVWAVDIFTNPTENASRIHDAGVADGVFPILADARALPFAGEFFDAIVSVDSFVYYGTDALYLNYLAHFVKPGGAIGVVGAGLMRDLDAGVPEHLRPIWSQDFWCLHSASWLRRHWERTGIVSMVEADTMPDGWRLWLAWHQAVAPDNHEEMSVIDADAGRYLGYIRVVGRRTSGVKLEEYCWLNSLRPQPVQYRKTPLLRAE